MRAPPAVRPLALAFILLPVACIQPPGGDLTSASGAVIDICASAPEGALCDDGNVCTVSDKCVGEICTGTVVPDGTFCTDGDPCTLGDSCKAGRCAAGPSALVCNDNLACTMDMCVHGAGCVFLPVGNCGADAGAGDAARDAAGDGAPADRATGADAAADAVGTADAPPDAGAAPDAAGPDSADVDAGTGGADAGAGGSSGADAGPPDAGGAEPPVEPPPPDASSTDAPSGADAGEAAGDDGGGDGAAGDGPTGTLLRASGGACSCASGGDASGPPWLLLALGAAFARVRRRARGID